jgi:hypothetical protein
MVISRYRGMASMWSRPVITSFEVLQRPIPGCR